MREISFSDGRNTVTVRSDPEFVWKPVRIGERAVMASGRIVMDTVGVKNTAEIPVGWLSPEDLARLKRMIAQSEALTVRYPTPEGDREDLCAVELPVFRAFRWGEDGVSQWYGVTLTVEQIGVDPPEGNGGSGHAADV